MSWRGGKDGASNDAEDYHPNLTLRDGYPILYDCTEELEEGITTDTLNFDFDYDVSILANANFTETLRNLEWAVLWNVAQSIGMKTCDFELQTFEMEVGQRHLRKSRNLQQNHTYVALIGSDKVDLIDWETGLCSTNLPGDQYDGTMCFPMQGRMQAVHAGNDVDLLEKYLLNKVQSVMNTSLVLVGDVKYVSYIGTRGNNTSFVNNSKTGGQTNTKSQQATRPSAILFLGVGLGIAVLVFTVVALLLRKHRRTRAAFDKEIAEIPHQMVLTDLTDVETVHTDGDTTPTVEITVKPQEAAPREAAPIEGDTPKPIPIATQRRRRKKKKKRRKRKPPPPIDPMESITEENEEEVYAESECDSEWSEYSSDDEESSTGFSEKMFGDDLLFPRSSSVGSNLSDASPSLSTASDLLRYSPPRSSRLTEANLRAMDEEKPARSAIKPLPPPWV